MEFQKSFCCSLPYFYTNIPCPKLLMDWVFNSWGLEVALSSNGLNTQIEQCFFSIFCTVELWEIIKNLVKLGKKLKCYFLSSFMKKMKTKLFSNCIQSMELTRGREKNRILNFEFRVWAHPYFKNQFLVRNPVNPKVTGGNPMLISKILF